MLSEVGFDISKITIRGYDINSQAIVLAKEGRYSEHSLHKIEKNIRDQYFIKRDNSYQISSKFREKVNFKQENIFELQGLSNQYDVILSRNMFIYFDDKNRSLALDIIVNLLKENGIYIKGHADNIKTHANLDNICYGVYKKHNL
jgi:chemotaxis protein methyltransferase CheR